MLLFAVDEDIENSSELAQVPELLRREDLTILLVHVMSSDLWHQHPGIDSKFLTPSLVVKTDTSSKSLDSKWISPGLKQNPNIA